MSDQKPKDNLPENWRTDQWFPDLAPEIREQLKNFHRELLFANRTLNLISITTVSNADEIYFADCILASQKILATQPPKDIHEFGSGNGFPGIILAILNKNNKIHLVENDVRKCQFLKEAIEKLSLTNCDVLNRQVEKLQEKSVQCAVSRGFAPLTKSLLLSRKAFVTGGVYFHLKGETWPSEVADLPSQVCTYWTPSLLGHYQLPTLGTKLSVVKTNKTQD